MRKGIGLKGFVLVLAAILVLAACSKNNDDAEQLFRSVRQRRRQRQREVRSRLVSCTL